MASVTSFINGIRVEADLTQSFLRHDANSIIKILIKMGVGLDWRIQTQ